MTDALTASAPGGLATPAPAIVEEGVFKLIVENAVDLIVRSDAARKRTYVSPSSREMLGFEPSEMLGGHAYQLVHPDDLQATKEVFGKIGPQHPSQDWTFRMRRADGSYIWIGARYRYLPEDDGLLAVLRDITPQKLAEQRLAEAHAKLEATNAQLEAANAVLRGLAHVDGLTGLANRRHFDELLEEEFGRARRQAAPLGLVLLDIDHFKAFNDTYGHPGGDECLRQVGRCVRDAVRRPSDHIARYGGEEFAMLLPATDTAGAADMAERVRDAVAGLNIEHAGSGFGVVTVSAGAAGTDRGDAGSNSLALVKAADIALYQAKASGRNCVRLAQAAPAMAE